MTDEEKEMKEWIEQRRKGSDLMSKLLLRNEELQKENAELKAQNKSLKNTLQAIATDTNEHITHNVAQNELDKWEPAE